MLKVCKASQIYKSLKTLKRFRVDKFSILTIIQAIFYQDANNIH